MDIVYYTAWGLGPGEWKWWKNYMFIYLSKLCTDHLVTWKWKLLFFVTGTPSRANLKCCVMPHNQVLITTSRTAPAATTWARDVPTTWSHRCQHSYNNDRDSRRICVWSPWYAFFFLLVVMDYAYWMGTEIFRDEQPQPQPWSQMQASYDEGHHLHFF